MENERNSTLTTVQLSFLSVLRIAIGWHFLYEGVVKLLDPSWSAAGYLASSRVFGWLVANPTLLGIVDKMNAWGLTLVGLGLIFGALTRTAAVGGILLLAMYYMAHPPLIRMPLTTHTEGSYLLIDKNLVEALALVVISLFPTGRFLGLDSFFAARRSVAAAPKPEPAAKEASPVMDSLKHAPVPPGLVSRRQILTPLITLPVFGGFVYSVLKKRGWESWEEKHLLAAQGTEAVTSATIKTFQFASLKDLKGTLPLGKVKDMPLSRVIMGGNLIGGWAHARDLIYASQLVKAYHTDQKVFETFQLAEQCGVNAIITNPVLARVINEYWRREGGKIQFISDCAFGGDAIEGIKVSVDGGANACYVQGGISDRLLKEGKVEDIGKAVDFIRSQGLPAGVGAHKLDTVKACVALGIKPDFWVKTLHHVDYWSARVGETECDNIWCDNPTETVEYMKNLEEPWIAFKILAAGAIEPKVAFPYAFKSGADFICVGMYDFQVVEDVNLALDVLGSDLGRERRWMA